MISLSLLALGIVTFLVVVTVAVMLGVVSTRRGDPLGCVASCGAVFAMFLAGIAGLGIVLLLAQRGRCHRHTSALDLERRLDRVAERVERIGERVEHRAERFGESIERLGERIEARVERARDRRRGF